MTGARRTPDDAVTRRTFWFTGMILLVCLMGQRFALPVAGKALSIAGPVGLAFATYGLLRGTLSFHRTRLLIFGALATLIALGGAWQALGAGGVGPQETSYNSMALFLAITGFATLTFAQAVDEMRFFRLVTFAFLLVALAGIAQFFAQFAGLSLFSFTGIVPEALLNETFYHLEIQVSFANLLKSNGFVLIEPSVFSQVMALALIIEGITTRRAPYLAAFVAGLIVSFSGTGWITLGAFVLGSAIGMGWRGLAIAGGLVGLLGAVMVVLSFASPTILTALTERMDEVYQPGTSGHLRFITPFWMLDDVFSLVPSAALLGIGAGRGEHLTFPYAYNVNTAVKVTIEYGLPAAIAYLGLFVAGRKTGTQAAIVFPSLVLIMVNGGYQEFSPMIFLVLLLTVVARLTPAPVLRRTAASGLPALQPVTK